MDFCQVFASAKAAIVPKRSTCHSHSCTNHVCLYSTGGLDSRTHAGSGIQANEYAYCIVDLHHSDHSKHSMPFVHRCIA